jgi:hypothetical protein
MAAGVAGPAHSVSGSGETRRRSGG